jgi:HAD superfamily hydrolase (TIGR01549 family)
MRHFGSREGYKFFDDALPALERLNEMGLKFAIISNADSRIRSVLKDLELPPFVDPIVLSDEERIEKPAKDIFLRTIRKVSATLHPDECLHVGDDLYDDYHGALNAGMRAVLLRRPGEEYDTTTQEEVGVEFVQTLLDLPDLVTRE